MSIQAFMDEHKPLVQNYLDSYFDEKQQEHSAHATEEFDVYQRLREFSVKGKMLRGQFVLLAQEMYQDEHDENGLKAACAMELLQSAVLIHDDIMDNDRLRRGKPTIYAQYEELGKERKVPDAEEYGRSVAMIAGDVGLFLAHELLALLDGEVTDVRKLFATESQKMCHGQLIDYDLGKTDIEPKDTEILTMYDLKTRRYTFYMPFMIGALLAHAPKSELSALESFTDAMGSIFQLKDDELGLFGDSEKIGKPAGSDIAEDKKTLFRSKLMAKASDKDKKFVHEVFGKGVVSHDEIKKICAMIEEYGVRADVNDLVKELSRRAENAVKILNISESHKTLLSELIEYNAKRNS